MPPTLNQRSRKGKTEAEAEGEAWQAATGALVLSLLGPRGQNKQQECPEDNGESVAPRMLDAVVVAVVVAVAVAVAVGIKAEQSAERNRQVSRWRGSTGATAASSPLRRRAQKRCQCYLAFVCSLCWVLCRRASVVCYFWRLREPVYGNQSTTKLMTVQGKKIVVCFVVHVVIAPATLPPRHRRQVSFAVLFFGGFHTVR